MRIIHPAWCHGPLCTATASAGEHRGELATVAVVGPDLVANVGLQLVQAVAVGGGTPRLVLAIGTDRYVIPRDTATSLADLTLALVRRSEEVSA